LYQKRHSEYPWLTPQAIAILESWLRPHDVGFEWGAGRSTLWFGSKVSHITSVEHDPEWFQNINEKIRTKGLSLKVNFLKRALDAGYESAIDSFPNRSLDFVLVDGRRRLQCIAHALPKVKKGGLLILDNAENYFPVIPKAALPGGKEDEMFVQGITEGLHAWRIIRTTNGIWDTVLWIKPVDADVD